MMFGNVVGRIICLMFFDCVVFMVNVLLCKGCGIVLIILLDKELINGMIIMFMIRLVVSVLVGCVVSSVLGVKGSVLIYWVKFWIRGVISVVVKKL